MTKAERHYAVGRGKTPVHSRFRKGQSGNPSGRPRGSPNFYTLLQKALQESVVVTERGRRKRVTKLILGATRLINKAAAGDHKALVTCAAFLREVDRRAAEGPREIKIRVVPDPEEIEKKEPDHEPR